MKITTILTILSLSFGHGATVVYFQDFSASNASLPDGSAVTEGVLQEMDNIIITGGSAATQATNGDYTYSLTSANGASSGDGFILNAPAGFVPVGAPAGNEPGAGIANIDEPATFTTGTVTLSDGATGSLTITLNSFNVGGEFISINSVEIAEHADTGEVTLSLNINGYGDFAPGGNENIGIETDFAGGSGGFTNVAHPIVGSDGATNFEQSSAFIDATGITGQNQGFGDTTFDFVIREGVEPVIPEPTSAALLGLGGLALLARRSR